MTLDDFLNHIEAGGALNTPEIYRLMDEMSDEARRVTCEINNSYHSQEELRAFMSRLTGKPVDETFKMFPPFYTDFGKNITIGRRVFIWKAAVAVILYDSGDSPPALISGTGKEVLAKARPSVKSITASRFRIPTSTIIPI